ncbi:MAG: hypothetical protein Salg2KO_22800 [Salibacteraceae bacterium]
MIIFIFLGLQSAAAQKDSEILPYISAEADELGDFAYSLFTIKNIANGKSVSLDMRKDSNKDIGYKRERNLIFLSGRQLISDDRILLDKFPELGTEIKVEISKIPIRSKKCLIQPFGEGLKKYSVIIISSYKYDIQENDFKCLVLGTSFLFGLQENIIDHDLGKMVKKLVGGM